MKKIYLVLMFLIPLFITACAGPGFLTRPGTSSAPNGIQIKFLQPIFPSGAEIDEGSQITALLEVTNFAECDAIGKICVDDGALSDAFGGFNKNRDCKQFGNDLRGAVEEKGKLTFDTQKFLFTSQPYQNLFTDININLNAIANYRCDITTSTSQVCAASYLDERTECKQFEVISGSRLGAKAAPVTALLLL